MADVLEKKSGGQVTIKIYPSGQLGNEREALELLQLGSLAITKVSAAVMESFTEEYKVLGLPYIFRDKQHAFSVFDGPDRPRNTAVGREGLAARTRLLRRGIAELLHQRPPHYGP